MYTKEQDEKSSQLHDPQHFGDSTAPYGIMENRNFEKHTFASVLVKESLSAITGGAVVSTFAL
jgi:hypothetical protein